MYLSPFPLFELHAINAGVCPRAKPRVQRRASIDDLDLSRNTHFFEENCQKQGRFVPQCQKLSVGVKNCQLIETDLRVC
jgi:hypothetical protein